MVPDFSRTELQPRGLLSVFICGLCFTHTIDEQLFRVSRRVAEMSLANCPVDPL